MKTYVPTTLDQYINESKSITLKRGYRGENPVVVGANAPVRNQILSYVAEGVKVGATDLKKFIAGLNETNANPSAAANMWLRRNGKYFVTESKGGRTFFKLSTLGQRLVNSFGPNPAMNEDRRAEFAAEIAELRRKYPDFDEELGEVEGRDKYADIADDLVSRYQGLGESKVSEKKTHIALDKINASELKKAISNAVGSISFSGGDKASADVLAIAKKSGYKAKLDEKKKYDFKDPKTGEPGITDDEEEMDECDKTSESVEVPKKAKARLGGKLDPKLHNLLDKDQDKDEDEIKGFTKEISEQEKGMSAERKARIEAIIENIKTRTQKAVNEAEEVEEEDVDVEDDGSDELSFDDLDLSGEGGEDAEVDADVDDAEVDAEEGEEHEEEESDEEEAEEELEGDDDKVEITEFIITVDDVDSAIAELKELGVDAKKVLADDSVNEAEDLEVEEEDEDVEDEEDDGGEYKDDEISVEADNWDALRGWLEDKGVDVEEMFGGEIEVEDVDDEDDLEGLDVDAEVDLEDEGEDLDLEGGEDADLDVALDGEGGADELELDMEEEPEVEEALTGFTGTRHENETANLIKGAKTVIIKYDK